MSIQETMSQVQAMSQELVRHRRAAARIRLPLWPLIVSGLYLLCEIAFNYRLALVMQSGVPSAAEIDALAWQGKALAASGLSWLVLYAYMQRGKGWFFRTMMFLMTAFVSYCLLHQFYETIMDHLAPETKLAGLELVAYRNKLVTSVAIDPELTPIMGNGAGVNAQQSLSRLFFGLLASDAATLSKAHALVGREADSRTQSARAVALSKWPEYAKRSAVSTQAYAKYLKASQKVDKAFLPMIARSWFQRESGGMEPDTHATFEKFAARSLYSTNPQIKAIGEMENEGVFVRHIDAMKTVVVRNRDVPRGMNEKQFRQYVTKFTRDEGSVLLPTVATINGFPNIRAINSALYLPALALMTSLASIVLGLGFFIGRAVTAGLSRVMTIDAPVRIALTVSACAGAIGMANLLAGVPASFTSALDQAQVELVREHPVAGTLTVKLLSLERRIVARIQ